ncbi:unnamed protein product [Soboliphyme baturini]|uniref:Sema domain-containing protein n=1 Tax=Soboliphyme baturini TaxID=241478 RepID=A0A183J5W2_9BILA|nr:unnamed protein product [Soboliphyme baturini]
MFYAIFTTSLNGFYGSAVCLFSLTDINYVFDQSPFKGQISSSHAWLPVEESEVPSPRPGQCVENTQMISDTALHFIKSHSLMHHAVPSISILDGPLIYKQGVIFTRILVDKVVINEELYYAVFTASDDGKIQKTVHWLNDKGFIERNVIAIYKLHRQEPIRAMQLLPQQFLYIAYDTEVAQFDVAQCSLYTTCYACANDPYCSWKSEKNQCYKKHDSHSLKNGWVQMSFRNPRQPACARKPHRLTKLLYPGDTIHLNCQNQHGHGGALNQPRKSDIIWLHDNHSIDFSIRGYLITIDGGLVVLNVCPF